MTWFLLGKQTLTLALIACDRRFCCTEWRFLPAIVSSFCIFCYYNNSTNKSFSRYSFPKDKKLQRGKKSLQPVGQPGDYSFQLHECSFIYFYFVKCGLSETKGSKESYQSGQTEQKYDRFILDYIFISSKKKRVK